MVIKPQFTQANNFSEGLAVVKIDGVLSNPYPLGMTMTKKGEYYGKYVFIDKSGKIIIETKADRAESFSEGLAKIEIKGKTGFIDKSGKFVIPPKYDTIYGFSDGLASYIHNGKWIFINQKGETAFSTKFDLVNEFERGLAWVQQGGLGGFENFRNAKYGYIDKTGKVIWQPTK
jgi:WG containing repeat